MINTTGKKIGIWGYGIVGKALLQYLRSTACHLSICDQKKLSSIELTKLKQQNISFYPQNNLNTFLIAHDYIVPSPGIDLKPYETYKHKWISEIDLFAHAWHKPIIAITGTVGKTTVTHILKKICDAFTIPVAIGGNIGTGMLSLIQQQQKSRYALLELSSWQLEQNKTCAPTIALWTNFSENHLDRHKSMENYFDAKYHILAHQKGTDRAILPIDLMHKIYAKNPKSSCIFFGNTKPHSKDITLLRKNHEIIYYENKSLYRMCNGTTSIICKNIVFPPYSFTQNWIAICAFLHILNVPIHTITSMDFADFSQPHRLEYVCTRNGADFYNDSKSTTPASTLASVEKFEDKRIHLFLGGLSKGTDKKPLIQAIKNKVSYIYCFGKEATELKRMCDQEKIAAYAYNRMQTALKQCIQNCQQGDIVLFSPAGSSFDLFKNYEERGNIFKKTILSKGLILKS